MPICPIVCSAKSVTRSIAMRKPRSALTEKNGMRIDVAPPADDDLPTDVAWLVAQGATSPSAGHRTRAFFDEATNPCTRAFLMSQRGLLRPDRCHARMRETLHSAKGNPLMMARLNRIRPGIVAVAALSIILLAPAPPPKPRRLHQPAAAAPGRLPGVTGQAHRLHAPVLQAVQFKDSSGNVVGFDVDMLDLVAKKLGVTREIVDRLGVDHFRRGVRGAEV